LPDFNFEGMGNVDVLQGLDFDSFLHQDGDSFNPFLHQDGDSFNFDTSFLDDGKEISAA
jgi:hypothetical protein